ncbi:hypothetical protein V2G26_001285 [Clonostachys chloroleuca]
MDAGLAAQFSATTRPSLESSVVCRVLLRTWRVISALPHFQGTVSTTLSQGLEKKRPTPPYTAQYFEQAVALSQSCSCLSLPSASGIPIYNGRAGYACWDPDITPTSSGTKFGKQIQKRQLEVPEYAASFVNYKALKKLIKKLSATPTLSAQNGNGRPSIPADSQAALQANKATFFFQLERELDKVNAFYLQKEAELKIRLKTLLDKKKVLQSRQGSSRRSAKFTTLEEGFQQFATDLNKLQQFVEVNGTAFSKILKKWDKTSKSKTKELYLSRAVEVQPFFNATVISELSDQATTSLQELGAWSDGIQVDFRASGHVVTSQNFVGTDEGDADTLLLDTVLTGNISTLRDLLTKMRLASDASEGDNSLMERITRTFLAAIHDAPVETLQVLLDTGLVDLHSYDDINERNCLHQAAIYGKEHVLKWGLDANVVVDRTDVYGRVPLHYASLHGRIGILDALLSVGSNTIDLIDHDNFTPLIHAIIHAHLDCVERLLSRSARIDPVSESDHVPLNLACEHGSVAVVEILLKHGAKIVPDAEGLYPQHLVARAGQTSDLLLLLQRYGADLDQVDKLYGWTPLVHAASEGNVECLQALLKAGVNPNILDESELPAMYYAAWEGHLECMKLLAPFYTRSRTSPMLMQPLLGPIDGSSGPAPMSLDPDAIPILELPPQSSHFEDTDTTSSTRKLWFKSVSIQLSNLLSFFKTENIQLLDLLSRLKFPTSFPKTSFCHFKKTLELFLSRLTVLILFH